MDKRRPAAWLALRLGRLDAAEQMAHASLALCQALNSHDTPGMGNSPLVVLAYCAASRAAYAEARRWAAKALVMAEQHDRPEHQAPVRSLLAAMALASARWPRHRRWRR